MRRGSLPTRIRRSVGRAGEHLPHVGQRAANATGTRLGSGPRRRRWMDPSPRAVAARGLGCGTRGARPNTASGGANRAAGDALQRAIGVRTSDALRLSRRGAGVPRDALSMLQWSGHLSAPASQCSDQLRRAPASLAPTEAPDPSRAGATDWRRREGSGLSVGIEEAEAVTCFVAAHYESGKPAHACGR